MKFLADLHLHSSYSRATSSELNFEHLNAWGQIKGIRLIGTGDCLHPAWFGECGKKLLDDGSGLFSLKPEFAAIGQNLVPASCTAPVRFMLNTEISSIYKKDGKVRKVHNVVCLPSIAAVEKLITKLERIGNLKSDGRPILGLDSRNLLEIVLECDHRAMLIPAHIWTPWFSALGSKSGFDSIQECFGDLSSHIHAVETGLSSDPLMNWRLSSLDPFALVSSSDAHSPAKLGRECTVFETDITYDAIFNALADPADHGLSGTVEFFPEEGKYHVDGHRKCGVRFTPQETIEHQGLCPKCKKPLTVGVLSRVEELADRPQGVKPPRAKPFKSLIPLCEILAEALDSGPATKTVTDVYNDLLRTIGGEFTVLLDAEFSAIEAVAGAVAAEGIRRMRSGEVTIAAGYDGEFGTIHLFTEAERHSLSGQENLFGPVERKKAEKPIRTPKKIVQKKTPQNGQEAGSQEKKQENGTIAAGLNEAQQRAVFHGGKRLIIAAGPGTGKTHTLTRRIAYVAGTLDHGCYCLALTFTNKAAAELRDRIDALSASIATRVLAGTIHSFCLALLRAHPTEAGLSSSFEIAAPDAIERIARTAWPDASPSERRDRLDEMSRFKAKGQADVMSDFIQRYDDVLRANNLLDFDTILSASLDLLRTHPALLETVQRMHPYIFVDEYQDINAVQRALILLLAGEDNAITVIGDPHQSIYGFRGSNVAFFDSFTSDFSGAVSLSLRENYRTAPAILAVFGQVIGPISAGTAQPLVATRTEEGAVVLYEASSAAAEAEYVVHTIERLVGGTSMFSHDSGRVGYAHEGGYGFSDIAILYRTNALRRELEEALHRSGIPYFVTGERPFHMNPQVIQLLALLEFAAGKSIAVETLTTLLESTIVGLHLKVIDSLRAALAAGPQRIDRDSFRELFSRAPVAPDCARSMASFFNTIEAMADLIAAGSIEQAVSLCQTLAPFSAMLEQSAQAREIAERLLRIARIASSFKAFIDMVLLSREDDGAWSQAEAISLSTLHASKGLEWPVVFIIGCEDGILPLSHAGEVADSEEERRILYVGMSRAKNLLYLTGAKTRYIGGEKKACRRSPFLDDIDEELVSRELIVPPKKQPVKPDAEQLSLF
jgi:DNA helicase II / ATP-dependent DNA helicase PcrA